MNSPLATLVLSVRVPPSVMALVDQVAAAQSCDRSEAVRQIINFGAPLMISGKGLNLSRILMTLEIVAEDCLARAEAKGQDSLKKLLETAQENMERHHV